MKKLYFAFIYLIFYIPLFLLVIFSFFSPQFTFNWYHTLFTDQTLYTATYHSFILSLTVATCAMTIGFCIAFTLYRYTFFGRPMLRTIIFILILTPEIIMGAALLIALTLYHVPLGFFCLLLALVSLCIPFVAITCYTKLQSLDQAIFLVAHQCGASENQVLCYLLLPILRYTLFATWLISFTIALNNVIVSFFVTGNHYDNLPLHIFGMILAGVNPEINALCTVLLAVTFIFVATAHYCLHRE